MFLPCMYQYDDDFYLVDCICDDNTDYGIQYGRLSNIIIEHKMQQCEFESNSGGDRVSYEVAQRVEKWVDDVILQTSRQRQIRKQELLLMQIGLKTCFI